MNRFQQHIMHMPTLQLSVLDVLLWMCCCTCVMPPCDRYLSQTPRPG